MFKNLQEKLKKVLGVEVKLTIPPESANADLAFACFNLIEGKNPAELAKEFKEKIEEADIDLIELVQTAGPYVNLNLKSSILAEWVLNKVASGEFNSGLKEIGSGDKLLIEYPSQNTHKEFHVGHLRNVCIGNTLVNLYTECGYSVIPVNYINDFGAHVAKCLWGIMNLDEKEPKENKQKWLGEVYVKASAKIKDNDELKKEVSEIQKQLENKEGEVYELFLKTKKWSLEGFDKIQKELKVEHKKIFFESDLKNKGQEIVDELLEKNIAQEGEKGAIIVDLKEYDLDVALLRKSDGAGLYLTSDLALAYKKKKIYPEIDESINITGIEQNFYFKQLFKILELIGFEYKMSHIGYGLVNLPSGKMSSREGNVILYEDVKEDIYSRLYKETKKRNDSWSDKKVKQVAEKLTLAAIKFSMQKHEANKNIVFDIDEVTSIEGYSGLYILYTIVRVNGLLRQQDFESLDLDYSLLQEKEEKQLLLEMVKYTDIVQKALRNNNPSTLTNYCFSLAQRFNDFYTKHKVIDEGDELLSASRMHLSKATKKILEHCLYLLSIDSVSEM